MLLDEVQLLGEFEFVLNSLIRMKNVDVYVTGSNARLNFRQLEETHAMENIIFNELKIRGFNVDVGVITLNKTNEKGHGIRKQLEIDFVCNKGSKRYYIQSAYAIPDQAKMEQEQRSLMLTGDVFKKIIITKDVPAPYYNDDGVLVMSVYDFLLNEYLITYEYPENRIETFDKRIEELVSETELHPQSIHIKSSRLVRYNYLH